MHGIPPFVQRYRRDGLRRCPNLLIGAMQNAQLAWLAWCLAACAEQYDTVRLCRQCADQVTQLGSKLSYKSMLEQLYEAAAQLRKVDAEVFVMQVLSGQLPLLVELLEDAPPHLGSCLVELICNCAELPAAKKVEPWHHSAHRLASAACISFIQKESLSSCMHAWVVLL